MRRPLAPIVLAVLLPTSFSGAPSDGRIRSQVVDAPTSSGTDKLYDIEGFTVVSRRPQGVNSHVASVHDEIVLKQGITRLPRELEADPTSMHTLVVLGAAMARAVISGTPIEVGSHIPVDDEVTLLKGDGGWCCREPDAAGSSGVNRRPPLHRGYAS